METALGLTDWDARTSVDLQQIVDDVCCGEVLNLDFSVTIADPTREDCPLVACSRGFTDLTGYTVQEIIGRNCRFLLDNVPEHLIDQENRMKCRTYIEASRDSKVLQHATAGKQLQPEALKKQWVNLSTGEILCVQTNARKSGELFKNMFYMKQVQLNGQSFVLGLQAGLPEEWDFCQGNELEAFCQEAFGHLGSNMSQFEVVLARHFWYSAAMRRQGPARTVLLPGLAGGIFAAAGGAQVMQSLAPSTSPPDSRGGSEALGGSDFSRQQSMPLALDKDWAKQTSYTSEVSTVASESSLDAMEWDAAGCHAPKDLYSGFDPIAVKPWPAGHFEVVHKLQDATRNQGSVCLMREVNNGHFVATKVMPNWWIKENHESFNAAHPTEIEQPWQDLGCNNFLDAIGYPFSIGLLGVYRDEKTTSVMTRFAGGGDLFGWASNLDLPPGPQREARIRPLARQLVRGVQQLHELQISHRDLSAENILIGAGSNPQVKVIDFGAASTSRFLQGAVGKPSYQAPEMFEGGDFDTFLTDAFAVGVTIYAACVLDYPWMDTSGRGDKCVQFIRLKGFKAYVARRRLPNSSLKVADVLSAELLDLLDGLLHFDPSQRLCLGESELSRTRPSAWEQAWLKEK